MFTFLCNNTTQQFYKPNQHLYECKNQAQESISPISHVHYQPSKCIENIIITKEKGCNNGNDYKIWNITLKIDAGQRLKCKKK